MLPRKIPDFYLVLIWLGGTIPYVLITFWLEDIPAPYPWLMKMGKLVSGFSAAFSTAFPFWALIEWFAKRKREREVAALQRRALDLLIDHYNQVVGRLLYEHPAKVRDHYTRTSSQHITEAYEAMLAQLKATYPQVAENRRTHPLSLLSEGTAFMEEINALMAPYMVHFPLDFSSAYIQVAKTYSYWSRQQPEAGKEWLLVVRTYHELRVRIARLQHLYDQQYDMSSPGMAL